MKIYRSDLFPKFDCLKEKCPVPCCHGWQIPVDPASVITYKNTKGLLGLKLRLHMSGNKDFRVFNESAGDCPFWSKNKLCTLQEHCGEDFMPGICRRFPRKLKNYGYFCEEQLELTCPAAATLFLDCGGRDTVWELEEEVSYPDTTENNDPAFLAQLLSVRANLISFLDSFNWEGEANKFETFTGLLFALKDYSFALQRSCISQGFERETPDLSQIPVPTKETVSTFASPLLYDSKTTDTMMCSGIYHSNLKSRIPLFYEICCTYFETFDPLTVEDANQKIKELFQLHFENSPLGIDFFVQYLKYYLQLDFLLAYENYSFARIMSIGIMRIHFLLLFFCLYESKSEALPVTGLEYANVLAAYERHMCHNDALNDSLWSILAEL